MKRPANNARLRKRPFLVDYEIHGTLHLKVRDSSIAASRAEAIIKRAMADLEEISGYCEHDTCAPIDAEQRYGAPP